MKCFNDHTNVERGGSEESEPIECLKPHEQNTDSTSLPNTDFLFFWVLAGDSDGNKVEINEEGDYVYVVEDVKEVTVSIAQETFDLKEEEIEHQEQYNHADSELSCPGKELCIYSLNCVVRDVDQCQDHVNHEG